ncbi:voltage-gated potassium channel [Rhizopogon vinicolor AM-OR11-026]|uniref:Voltage-gated potassium channel n=1 Tax=Rhizopogon vinicolor AM-OR11-026 TaxID=1314800 RepID=A0A1B7MY37_9AGAM|nr:voltage-gated potassium channel [Rhizopogon vinicolor AM-OR11-026]
MAIQSILALIFSFSRSTSSTISDPEKVSPTNRDSGAPVRNHREEDSDEGRVADADVDVGPDDDDEGGTEPDESDSGPRTNAHQLHGLDPPDHPSFLVRVKTFIFPPSSDDSSFVPNYRLTPLISGIVIPFSILLEIPGLTGHWYIRTEGNDIVETRPNSAILDAGLAISMACAVIANACLIVRFLEKRVMTMTLSCILFLSIHDIINVIAVTVFGVSHRFNDGFTYAEAFWMTVCSTVVSFITNVTLIIDFIRTPNFKISGSGLTRKQRTLMIILIFLFIYIALGSMINSFLLSLSFINGLYFTVTTIETIGFGDIAPDSPGSRVFICFYAVFGIINIAVVIGMVQETVREGLHIGYIRRLQDIRERRRVAQRRKRAEKRWRSAVIWRLREKGAPVWIRTHAAERTPHSTRRRRGMRLNLEALTHSQLEAAAMEAGVPLDTLLPPSFYEAQMENERDNADDLEIARIPPWSIPHPVYGANMRGERQWTLTDQRLGAMAALLTRFAIGFSRERGEVVPQATVDNVSSPIGDATTKNEDESGGDQGAESSTIFTTTSSNDDVSEDYLTMVANTENQALYVRSIFAWSLFVVFWVVGAAIFSKTEGWSYGTSIYFCYVAFTTIGYGDLSPTTPAGRSVFVVWALLGVAAMSVFISVASEAYSKRYKGMLENSSFVLAVQHYRNRMKQKYFTKAWSQVQSPPQAQDLTQTQPQGLTSSSIRFQSRLPSTSSAGLRNRATLSFEQHNEGGEGSHQPSERERDAEINAADQNLHVQHLLEALPRHVLNEALSFQEYVRYLGNNDVDTIGSGNGTHAYLNERLKSLLDDVIRMEGMKKSVEVDILKDKDNMRALVALSIEKSLMELISVAEGAIAAINERDRITAALQKELEDVDEADTGG